MDEFCEHTASLPKYSEQKADPGTKLNGVGGSGIAGESVMSYGAAIESDRSELANRPLVWSQDGVFYAEITHSAASSPFAVALHGITNPEHANRIAEILSRAPVPIAVGD